MVASPMLTRRAVILAGVETTYDTSPVGLLNPATDAMLVEAPDFQTTFKELKRMYVQPSISAVPHLIGMKQAHIKFGVELTGNGQVGTPPRIGRMLRGCGMAETAKTAAWVGNVYPVFNTPSQAVNWGTGGSPTVTDVTGYIIAVTTAGASGTAKVTITPTDPTLDTASAAETITSGTALTIGSKGLTCTPSFSGSLAVGYAWFVAAYPPGVLYQPRSSGMESVNMQFFVDGSVHSISGAYGTFTMKADAGNFATLEFDFTGRYLPYSDSAFPTPVFETKQNPPIFQQAGISVGNYNPVVSALSFDIKNTIAMRSSAAAQDGYLGCFITQRDPTGGVDPEATIAANQDFWDAMAQYQQVPITARIGQVAGNKIWFGAPAAQYTNMTYKDAQGIRTYNAGLSFPSVNGDDEAQLFFY